MLFVHRETAHKTLEEVFEETAFVDAGEAFDLDPNEASMSMHVNHGARSMNMDGASSRNGSMVSPPQTIPEVEKGRLGIPDIGARVVDEKGSTSALTSRTTVTMEERRV
jgi:hypothetical protein